MTKPVKDLVAMLRYAFANGECRCVRCEGGANQSRYEWAHNFIIDGRPVHRQFARSSLDDFTALTMAVLKQRYKNEEFAIDDAVVIDRIGELMDGEDHRLFLMLAKTNGIVWKQAVIGSNGDGDD